MNTINTNPFDFTDLSDLPEDLQTKLKSTKPAPPVDELVDLINKGHEAGFASLSCTQIRAAAYRVGLEIPSNAKVLEYIKIAIEQNKVYKYSRQTYAVGTAPDSTESTEHDPLLDL